MSLPNAVTVIRASAPWRESTPRYAPARPPGAPPAPPPAPAALRLAAPLSLLDAAGVPAAVLDAAEQLTATTRAFDVLRAADAGAPALLGAMRALARELCGPPPRGPFALRVADAPGAQVAARQVTGARRTYALWATRAAAPGPDRESQAVVVVVVGVGSTSAIVPPRCMESQAGRPAARAEVAAEPREPDLRAAYQLSAREAQVARLLARGLTTAAVGAALGISAHTARHHAERLYAKLGVRSRAALGALVSEAERGRPVGPGVALG